MSSFMQVPATVIPQRYVIGILGLFALANAYTMRVCLSMTITQMVARVASEEIVGDTCPDDEDYLFRSNMRNETMVYTVGHDWGYFTMITDLPKYISGVLKFNIKDTGFLSALPYLAMYPLSFIFAGFCDMCIRKDWHSITTGRKIYTTVSSTLPAIFIILASYSGCDGPLAVTMFVLAMSFMAGFYSSVKINAMDIAPNYAGTCSAMVNGLAAFSGIITPYLFGLLTPDQTVQQWRLAFWTVFAVLVITNIAYLIWGSGKQQWWDDVDKYGYPPGWKHGPLKKRTEDPEKKVVKPKHDHSPISDD
ncbi:putative inorganic phosphate cotransporter isoform X3 [Leptidea sinapis]|uniref:putative inorganic phosphate cotransporter isoform X3 n=1 Tax=Leptidea sinapis TaxID=189913 RepID=UPI0021C29A28|nr:putative inorganic phosphate cotransporter isoform X3 [Leptidea sinapis]